MQRRERPHRERVTCLTVGFESGRVPAGSAGKAGAMRECRPQIVRFGLILVTSAEIARKTLAQTKLSY